MDMTEFAPFKDRDAADVVNEGDYVAEDGLWRCGVCGEAKQKRIDSRLIHKTVWCACECRRKELEELRKKDEYEEGMRRVRSLKGSSRMADIYQNAFFSSYIVREENKMAFRIAQEYVRDFCTMRNIGHPKTGERNMGLVFYGKVGTGKSYTAACIANALLEMQVSVIMTSFVRILQDMQGNMDEAGYIHVLNGCSLLVIDDLGAERNTDYALEKVYGVIDSRVRVDKPMILTTNLSFEEMMRNGDMRYRRIYDRIFEHCVPVEMGGSSFRIIRAAQRQKSLADYYK